MVKSLFKIWMKRGCILFVCIVMTQVNADVSISEFFIEPLPGTMTDKEKVERSIAPVDYVVVKKSKRKLFLYAGADLVKSYSIALGKQPKGQKEREGDSRTPEGLYILDWRNPHSKFFRSIHVSYPSVSQARNAKEAGIDLVHQENEFDEFEFEYDDYDYGYQIMNKERRRLQHQKQQQEPVLPYFQKG